MKKRFDDDHGNGKVVEGEDGVDIIKDAVVVIVVAVALAQGV